MPYTRDGRCVKKEGGATVKCHETVAQAEAHLNALRTNVSAQEKTMTETKHFQPYSQDETRYTTVSLINNQLCANCRFFMPESEYGPECRIVAGYPEPILATGGCDEWTARRTAEEMQDPTPVVLVDERAATLKRLVGQLVDRFKNKPFWEAGEASGFKVYGHKRWVAWWTNNWYDHEQEVFPRVAIDHYLKRVADGQEPYPDLRFGHLPHTEHGKADWLGRVDNIVMATGCLDDSPLAHKFESYYREAPKRGIRIKVSHGFKYRPVMKVKGAYFDFTTFEISPIPEVGAFRAANPYTMWEVKTMTYPQEFRDELARALSDDGKTLDDAARARADQMISAAETVSKTAAAEGREQKSATVTPADNAARLDALETTLSEKFESFSTAFNDKMSKALTAFETGVQTNVKAADKFDAVDKKLETIEGQIAEINTWRKSQTDLAPPPSRHKGNVLADTGAVAQWLTEEEAKTTDTKGLSVVEQVLGQRVTTTEAAAAQGGA